jgi:hypothetical protein
MESHGIGDFHGTDTDKNLKELLFNLINNKLDQFELMNVAGRFSIPVPHELSFSTPKLKLQQKVLQQLLKVESGESEHFSRLLEETKVS